MKDFIEYAIDSQFYSELSQLSCIIFRARISFQNIKSINFNFDEKINATCIFNQIFIKRKFVTQVVASNSNWINYY